MTKRALLVGINYPGESYSLNGCVNDATLMSEIAASKFGFNDPKNRRMLTNESATAQNIVERLQWLVDGAVPGDVLFFFYSGHGSQVINLEYDDPDFKTDNMDEIICPIDIDWRHKVIRDDDLKRIFDTVPLGVNLTVILDCCHSGTGIDSMESYRSLPSINFVPDKDVGTPNRARYLPMPPDIANRGRGLDLKAKPRSVQSKESSAVLISACLERQVSVETFVGNMYAGVATFSIAKSLEKHNFDVDYKTLVDEASAQIYTMGYGQTPELNGSQEFLSRKFLQPLS